MSRKTQNNIFYIFIILILWCAAWYFLSKIDAGSKILHPLQTESSEQSVQELININNQIDSSLLEKKNNASNDLDKKKDDLEKIIEETVQTQDTDKFILAPKKSQYQLELLDALYKKSNNELLLPSLFELALDMRRFDEALVYLLELQNTWWWEEVVIQEYIYALYNSAQLDFGTLNALKKVADEYLQEGYITPDDHNLYYSLITFVRWDMVNYEMFMSKLQDTDYADRYTRYQWAKQKTQNYVDVPEYYLQWLVAIGIFQEWWYRIVQKSARSLISQDSTYLLGYQLDAYASVMLWDRVQAYESLSYLSRNDIPNKELYAYLQWVSLYYQERYPDAILALQQLQDQWSNKDVLRYRLLSYSKMSDTLWVTKSIRLMTQQSDLTIYDYFWIFDELFYSNDRSQSLSYVDGLYTQLQDIFGRCYDDMLDEEMYVCLYGKWWLYLVMDDTQKAYQYLQRVTQRYPQPELYEHLGDLAIELDLAEEASRRYIQWLMQTSVLDDQEALKDKVKWLMQ